VFLRVRLRLTLRNTPERTLTLIETGPENGGRSTPPHVDEDVTFDFNDDAVAVAADSVVFLLTKVKAGSGPMDLAIELTYTLVGGTEQTITFEYASDAPDVFSLLPGYTDVLMLNMGGASLGFLPTDLLDSVTIGARDDPADPLNGTDEHFLINGFSVDYEEVTNIPEPATMSVMAIGALSLIKRRKK
jgi:hypothetical protein